MARLAVSSLNVKHANMLSKNESPPSTQSIRMLPSDRAYSPLATINLVTASPVISTYLPLLVPQSQPHKLGKEDKARQLIGDTILLIMLPTLFSSIDIKQNLHPLNHYKASTRLKHFGVITASNLNTIPLTTIFSFPRN